jgi:hypothetical protein
LDRNKDKKPHTLAEAVEILRSRYPQDQLDAWAVEPLPEALWKAHFQLGLWIRNKWIYEDPAPLVARFQSVAFPAHPDAISEHILEAFWRVLNGEECPTIEELLERRYPGLLATPEEGRQA